MLSPPERTAHLEKHKSWAALELGVIRKNQAFRCLKIKPTVPAQSKKRE